MNKADTYVFDTSHVSMKGIDIGFSSAPDDVAAALTSGVTKTGAAGNAGSNVTVVLAEDHSGAVHIYAAQANPSVVTIAVKVDQNGALLFNDAPIPSNFSINEGDTSFDTSDASMANQNMFFSGKQITQVAF